MQNNQTNELSQTDEAREYVIEYMRQYFNDKTFADYIRTELAGDFAYQLANTLRSRSGHVDDIDVVDIPKANAVTVDELESLRKDAERYRWLRDSNDVKGSTFAHTLAHNFYGVEWDEKIDAAINNSKGGV